MEETLGFREDTMISGKVPWCLILLYLFVACIIYLHQVIQTFRVTTTYLLLVCYACCWQENIIFIPHSQFMVQNLFQNLSGVLIWLNKNSENCQVIHSPTFHLVNGKCLFPKIISRITLRAAFISHNFRNIGMAFRAHWLPRLVL